MLSDAATAFGMSRSRLGSDARRVLTAQGLRALVYGFGSVLLATDRELSAVGAGRSFFL